MGASIRALNSAAYERLRASQQNQQCDKDSFDVFHRIKPLLHSQFAM